MKYYLITNWHARRLPWWKRILWKYSQEENKMSKEADHMSTEEQVERYLIERAIQRDDG